MKKHRKMLSNWQARPIEGLMRLIETQSKETLANWAVDYTESHFLPITPSNTRMMKDLCLRWNMRVSGSKKT